MNGSEPDHDQQRQRGEDLLGSELTSSGSVHREDEKHEQVEGDYHEGQACCPHQTSFQNQERLVSNNAMVTNLASIGTNVAGSKVKGQKVIMSISY